jgi:hypothetical protein
MVQVRPYGLLLYNRIEIAGKYNSDQENRKKPDHELYTGVISDYSKKRLRRAITLLVCVSDPKDAINFKTGRTFKFRVNFITLTLPCEQGLTSDKDLKSLVLDVWIKRMRRKYKLRSYIWRAEKQFNGNIHFHFITDTYIRFDHIRNDWNSCLQRFNYIDLFESRHGHRNPNSTDVHSVNKITNLTQYFIKYMSKGITAGSRHWKKDTPEVSREIRNSKKFRAQWMEIIQGPSPAIQGKIWDCSTNLKVKENCEFEFAGVLEDEINYLISTDKMEVRDTEVCSLAFVRSGEFESTLPRKMLDGWKDYLSKIKRNA